MAVNDLITRLILENKEFDGNLKRSQKEMKNFQKEISGKVNAGIGNLNQGLGKLGLSLGSIGWGAAIAGGISFAKMGLDATQKSDDLNNILNASTQTLESFAGALMTADMSTFSDGLLTAWQRANDLSAALDGLADSLLAKSVFDSRVSYEFNESLLKIRDTSLSIEERQKEVNAAKELNTSISERNLKVQNQIRDVVEKTWLAETGQSITNEQIRNLAEVGDEYDDLYAKQQALNKAASKLMVDPKTGSAYGSEENKKAYKEARAALSGYSKEQITLAKNWQKFNDKQRKGLSEQLILENQIYQQQQSQGKTLIRAEKSLTTETKAPVRPPKKDKEPVELYKSYDSLIAKAEEYNNKIKEAKSTSDVAAINFYMSELAKLNTQIASLQKIASLQTSQLSTTAIPTKTVDIGAINEEMKAYVKANQEMAKSDYERAQAAVAAANLQQEATYGLIESLGSAIEMNDMSAASFIRMVAKILPQIAVLVAAKNTQTVAETTSSGGAAGGVPGAIAGLAVGLGLVASILSATVKPKFAGGGIVGDRNLVRMNQGEMVLNHAQQTRLFNSINSGRMESNTSSEVQFVLRGQDLIGLQKNYNSKFGKNGNNY